MVDVMEFVSVASTDFELVAYWDTRSVLERAVSMEN